MVASLGQAKSRDVARLQTEMPRLEQSSEDEDQDMPTTSYHCMTVDDTVPAPTPPHRCKTVAVAEVLHDREQWMENRVSDGGGGAAQP